MRLALCLSALLLPLSAGAFDLETSQALIRFDLEVNSGHFAGMRARLEARPVPPTPEGSAKPGPISLLFTKLGEEATKGQAKPAAAELRELAIAGHSLAAWKAAAVELHYQSEHSPRQTSEARRIYARIVPGPMPQDFCPQGRAMKTLGTYERGLEKARNALPPLAAFGPPGATALALTYLADFLVYSYETGQGTSKRIMELQQGFKPVRVRPFFERTCEQTTKEEEPASSGPTREEATPASATQAH
jgi:hypothetical protein